MIARPSMKFFLTAGSLILLQGCYFADDLFLENPPPAVPALQDRCEDAVEAYIRGRITSEQYTPFAFSDAIVYVPEELAELEKKEEVHVFGADPRQDSMIVAERKYVEANRIQRTAQIEHFFTLKTVTGNLQIVEAKYTLDDTLGVFDFTPVTLLEVPDYYETALHYFFHNYTIFDTPYINESRKLSNDYYKFFKEGLEQKNGVQARSDFYYLCLKITEMVRLSGAFDPNQVAQALVHDDQVATVSEDLRQKDIDFSPLYEKRVDSGVQGYYIFYKFSQTFEGNVDTAVLRFDFSPYYEIESKAAVSPPFDSYF
jgi:hypothetical protein